LIKAFIKYCTAGGFATSVHYAIFLVAIKLMAWLPWQATLLGASAGALVSYILNYHFTFFSKASHAALLPAFLMVASLGVITQTMVVAVLSQYWHVQYLVSQIIATIVGLVLTFLINRFWTFA
jgi:putative flippase GtrA